MDRPAPPRDFDALRAELAARAGSLSKRLTQVAQFFLNHPEEVAVTTLVRLADQAASAARHDHTLRQGARIRRALPTCNWCSASGCLARACPMPNAWPSPASRMPTSTSLDTSSAASCRLRCSRFCGSRRRWTVAQLDAFVEVLADSDVVHVAAARGAFGLGAYTVYGLGSIGRRAHLIDNLGAMRAMQVRPMGPNDTLLVDDLRRLHARDGRDRHARRRAGPAVLAITDNALSPVAGLATHVLYVNEARLGHFRSQVPAMVVCQAMIVGAWTAGSVRLRIINPRKMKNLIASTRATGQGWQGEEYHDAQPVRFLGAARFWSSGPAAPGSGPRSRGRSRMPGRMSRSRGPKRSRSRRIGRASPTPSST